MKSLAIAIGITIALGALLFGVCHWMGVADKVAGPIASSTVSLITFFHDRVDKALSASGASRITPGIVPIELFGIKPAWMLLYVTLVFGGLSELLGGIGVAAAMSFSSPVMMVSVIVAPSLCMAFFVGRWAGIRSGKHGYWIFACACVLMHLLDSGLSWRYLRGRGGLLDVVTMQQMLWSSLGGLLLTVTIGSIGVWAGNRLRFAAYFNSLLKQVSSETRETLLALAFDEARTNPKPGAVALSGVISSPRA